MSALLDSLAAGFRGNTAQRALLDTALHDGLPGPRSEAWKYTSLRSLERRRFGSMDDASADFQMPDDARMRSSERPRVVFVNGRFDASLSNLSLQVDGVSLGSLATQRAQGDAAPADSPEHRFKRADEVFARLNLALARDGVVLRVEDGVQLAVPIELVFVGTPANGDIAVHLRHLVEIGEGASATLLERHIGMGDHAHLGNHLWQVRLGNDAQLSHARLQQDAGTATCFARTDAFLAADAHYRRIDLELGAALSRNELNVRLEGERARLDANGVLLGNERRHLDTRLGIEHVAPGTACGLVWRGLAGGRARVAFHGGITIQTGADGTAAELSNKNLLLSEHAEIDTQPVLEIHADEVTAAHGATVGQLDPTALFYLRSRGLPQDAARRLLTAAFCREVVAGTGIPLLQAVLDQTVDDALAAMGARQ